MFSPTLVTLLLATAGAHAQYVGYQAYDPTQPVSDPPLPDPAPALDFAVQLDYGGNPTAGLPVKGSFLGVSIEMVLVEDIIGSNKSYVHPEFLNLMSNLKARGGTPVLRLGGNSQEIAYLVSETGTGAATIKEDIDGTRTKRLVYTQGVVEAMRTASDAVGIEWFVGQTMNQTNPPRLEFVELAEQLLGDKLKTIQLGNEPDLYPNKFRANDGTYTPQVYLEEVQSIIDAMKSDSKITSVNKIGGPSLCECVGSFKSPNNPLTDLDYLGKFHDYLNSIIVMHYPTDNCPTVADYRPTPQNFMNGLLTHTGQYSPVGFARRYDSLAATAAGASLPLVLLEFNTASCNGFLGVSDSFGASLWILDLALQLAASGFSNAMMHLGGQTSYYSPFLNPPENATDGSKWSVFPNMYTLLLMSEALGPSGNARVADLNANSGNDFTPGYVIYEDNKPARLVLMNYMTDSTGAHDYTANVQVQDGTAQVSVRYLAAKAATSKSGITYAGQGWGGYFESDGTLQGQQKTETVPCSGGQCAIKVPAPGVAVVFLTGDIFDASKTSIPTFNADGTTGGSNGAGGSSGSGGSGGTGSGGGNGTGAASRATAAATGVLAGVAALAMGVMVLA
ncbi:hypothetical protein EXIGLDRAFT_664572 [Exidia glandulosa HHB12029]|uniref:Beta-glucuronidase C-terminal domain-containing protein n=1 Tax=Exidia glandulosa HHB12029 TaxID=1314781 RepID=A0A165QBY8_EXIGL|nr:hypothetical protein EXIGLDRAFT_664572 [Exidia glandulosa HHB12029]